jgi:hypothetical protein
MIPGTFQEWLTPTFGLMGGENVFCPSVLRRFNPELLKPEKDFKICIGAIDLSTCFHAEIASVDIAKPAATPHPTPKVIFLKAIILRATGAPSGSLKNCGGLPTLDRAQ